MKMEMNPVAIEGETLMQLRTHQSSGKYFCLLEKNKKKSYIRGVCEKN